MLWCKCDVIIVMNVIKDEIFVAHEHAIYLHTIVCLTTQKVLLLPLFIDFGER